MHRIVLLSIGISVPLFTGCKSGNEPEQTEVPSEVIQSLEELRSRIDLSDEELVSAIERLAKTETAWREAIDAGLTTEEEIAQMHASMPKTLQQLDQLRDEMLGQDAMAAAVSLATLRHYHDDSIDEALPTLRWTITNYYRSIGSTPNETEATFISKVDNLAERDHELASELQNQ